MNDPQNFRASMLEQIYEMKDKMDKIAKDEDEALAYSYADKGDQWDKVRQTLRSGYEIDCLVVGERLFERLASNIIANTITDNNLFRGMRVERDKDCISETAIGVKFIKSQPSERRMARQDFSKPMPPPMSPIPLAPTLPSFDYDCSLSYLVTIGH